jgi:hypothetical protein
MLTVHFSVTFVINMTSYMLFMLFRRYDVMIVVSATSKYAFSNLNLF